MTGFNFDDSGASPERPENAAQIVPGENWVRGAGDDVRTKLTATWLNSVKANLTNLVIGLGGDPLDGDNQLLNAVKGVVLPHSKFDANGPPTTSDDGANTSGRGVFKVRSKWYDQVAKEVWECLANSTGEAVWVNTSFSVDDLGTAAAFNVGSSPYNIVQLDGAGKLPALDGSQLLNLPASGGMTADNIRVSGTFGIGDDEPEFRYKTGGGNDTNWKNIADIVVQTGSYRGLSLDVEILDTATNFGSSVSAMRHKFTVAARRSSATQDDYDDGLLAGTSTDYVRLVKTATGLYELQVRQVVANRHITSSVKVTSHLGASITYHQNPSNGSATGTIYTVSDPDPFHGVSFGDEGFTTVQEFDISSSASSITFNNLADYRELRLRFLLRPVNDNVHLFVRTSTTNGVNFDSGSSDYSWCRNFGYNGGSGADGYVNDGLFKITPGVRNYGGAFISGLLNIAQFNQNDICPLSCEWTMREGSGNVLSATSGGFRKASVARDAIRMQFSAGYIASGYARLEGLKS
jgi:hypothetical protein